MNVMVYENKLPRDYEQTQTVKADIKLYAASGAVLAIALVLGCVIKGVDQLLNASGVFTLALKLLLTAAIAVLSLFAQEYIKCVAIGKVTGKPARVVREKGTAYVEYRCWLDKRAFMIISFAPAAAICLISLILAFILADKLFWQAYLVFALNFAGMTGDGYTAIVLAKLTGGVRIKNEGLDTLIATEKQYADQRTDP